MLKLLSLHLNNIGRFTKKQHIPFRNLSNLILVDADNKNTGGSSGSGKSTIFNALDYLLGLNDIPNTVLQSRITEEPIEVSGMFLWDDKELTIIRSKHGLVLNLPNETIKGNNRLAEERLDEILAMPRDIFRKILHKRQKEGGFFLQFTPQKMNEFLTDCLGLTNLRTHMETLDDRLKVITEDSQTFISSIASNSASLEATNQAILAIGEPPKEEITEDMLVFLVEAKKKADEISKATHLRHNIEFAALDLEHSEFTMVSFDRTRLTQLQQTLEWHVREVDKEKEFNNNSKNRLLEEIAYIKDKIRELEDDVKRGEDTQVVATKKALEIKSIRQNICPTCEQHWDTPILKSKEEELLKQIVQLKQFINKGKTSSEEIPNWKQSLVDSLYTVSLKDNEAYPQLEKINEFIRRINEEIKTERKREEAHAKNEEEKGQETYQVFRNKQTDIRRRHALELQEVQGQQSIANTNYNNAIQKIQNYKINKAQYVKVNTQLQESAIRLQNQDKELQAGHYKLTKEIQLNQESKRAIKSFMSRSFDYALQYISESATRIIRNIPNMANATIELEGIKETKEGKVKEEVNAVLSMDGDIGVPIKSLSGGERSSIDLAIDLSVIDLIETKTGKGIDLFILDEPFNGLDTVSIEMALEVLRSSNPNKRLILVDHNPEAKEMIDSKITVVRDGITSEIVCN